MYRSNSYRWTRGWKIEPTSALFSQVITPPLLRTSSSFHPIPPTCYPNKYKHKIHTHVLWIGLCQILAYIQSRGMLTPIVL